MQKYSVSIYNKETLAHVASAVVEAWGLKEAKAKALIATEQLRNKKHLVLSCAKLRK